MAANVYNELEARGFIEQVTDSQKVCDLLGNESITFYVGFDPTAESLHVGSLVPLMAMKHMQMHGHKPIAILGGGTAMIGDPSGKTDMRKMLSREDIMENSKRIEKQIGSFIDLAPGSGQVIDNADWLMNLSYIDFLRKTGRHFSVNRMLAAEAYKARLESGLSFLEFNYQLLQAYDFLVLFRKNNCKMQMGGNDQWGNILAGTELIRREMGKDAFALTFPLLTTSTGQKMGKTAKGAIWLDREKTSPYHFYQYWINVDDQDVLKWLKFFTLLPMSEIEPYEKLKGAELREAKKKLAFEITKIVHSKADAVDAENAAESLFGNTGIDGNMPVTSITQRELDDGVSVVSLFTRVGLTASNGEARRMARGGGLYIGSTRVDDERKMITSDMFIEASMLLRLGKKKYHRVRIVG